MRGAKQKKIFEISDLRREILHLRSTCLFSPERGGGGGGTLIFSCIHRLRLFLGVQIFWGFRKLNIFFFWGGGGGYEDFVDIFSVITKLDYTMHFRDFSEGQGTKWRIFFGMLKFQIFIWSAWNSWFFFGGGVNGRSWARAYVWRKNESTPAPLSWNISL